MKVCPVCNSRCFDDMDICYGCMHNFKNEKEVKSMKSTKKKQNDDRRIPEYFELETFPCIEDASQKKNFERCATTDAMLKINIELPVSVLKKYCSDL